MNENNNGEDRPCDVCCKPGNTAHVTWDADVDGWVCEECAVQVYQDD